MDHFELVEKLREKTGVSYEDAKAALEAAEWDLLDAIVILESEGKVEKGAKDYSTRRESEKAQQEGRQHDHSQFKETMKRIGNQFVYIFNKGNEILINVNKNGKVMFSMPATVLAVLMIFMFWCVVPLLVVGLFFGFSYSVGGSSAGAGAVNSAMDKASEFAQNIKNEMENKH